MATNERSQNVTLDQVRRARSSTEYSLSSIPFHTHNGTDSNTVKFTSLSDAPISYYQQAGKSVIVNSTETGLTFGSGVTRGVTQVTSTATPTPDVDTTYQYEILALSTDAVFGAPTGTPVDAEDLVIRIKDDLSTHALSFNAVYRFSSDLIAPTATVPGKTLYLGFRYNSADTKWDNLAQLGNLS